MAAFYTHTSLLSRLEKRRTEPKFYEWVEPDFTAGQSSTSMADESYKSRTLFVRNLPFSTTNEKLTTVFEDTGPIKQCFVVRDKDSNQCKGFGYVKFSLIDDAVKAKETVKSIDGRKIFVSFADYKKKKPKKRRTQQHADESDDEEGQSNKEDEKVRKPTTDSGGKENAFAKRKAELSGDSKYLKAKIVVLTGVDQDSTEESISSLMRFCNIKKIARVVFPVEDRMSPTAFLKFKCVRDAKLAIRRLHGKTIKGWLLSAVQLSKESVQVSQKQLKRCRLIVRNLSFQVDEAELQSQFVKFGELGEVKIPVKLPDGKRLGFGFVQFTNAKEAEAALTSMNGIKIRGRPIAVDWALAKNTYEAVKDKTLSGAKEEDEGSYSAESTSDKDSEQDKETDHESSESEDEEVSTGQDSEDSDSVSSDEGFTEEMPKKKKTMKVKNSDVDEGKTLFIRNVPFKCEEEDLQDVLADFGDIVYCKLVVDPFTQHTRGTAFVKFSTKEEAGKCLAKAEDTSKEGGITLLDRPLKISYAMKQADIREMKEKEKNQDKTDKRNLFLIREGLIRAGTKAAVGLSQSDLTRRTKIETEMRQRLKNPNIFVSSTRLCVQNLPLDISDKDLKKKFTEAVTEGNPSITECRIMRDKARVNSKGKAKSRGFGFVDFQEHKHAVEALHNLNNTVYDNKRLIVHFSLENQTKLIAKQKKLERLKARKTALAGKDETPSKSSQGVSVDHVGKHLAKVKAGVHRKVKQDKLARDSYTGPKGLPSHSGPKIRHKTRPEQNKTAGKSAKKDEKQDLKRRRVDNTDEAPARKKMKSRKQKKKTGEDDFDRLVQSYKNRITSATGGAARKKWFT